MNCWYEKICGLKKNSPCDNMSRCVRYNEMLFMLENSGIPQNRWFPVQLDAGVDYEPYCRLDDYKNSISDKVNNGENLYICGKDTGNGKTSWSIKIMLKYFDDVWAGNGYRVRGLFIHVPQLLVKLKTFSNPLSEEYKENILNCDLVIWDDLASTGVSEYDLSQLLSYMDYRIISNKSNIFTGNLVRKIDLAHVLGERLASRIWNSSEIIELKGKDRRNG